MSDTTNGVLIGAGLEANGVLIHSAEPLGALWFPLKGGLTVLYGRNGAGKSRVLDAVASALRGVAIPGARLSVQMSPVEYSGGFDPTLIDCFEPFDSLVDLDFDKPPASRPSVRGAWEARDYDGVDAWVVEHARSLKNYLRAVGEEWGLAEGRCHTPRLSLVATGTVEKPGWDAYVSVIPTEMEAFIHAYPLTPEAWTAISFLSTSTEHSDLLPTVVAQRVGDGWRAQPLPVNVARAWTSTSASPSESASVDGRGMIACLVGSDETNPDGATLELLRSDEDVLEEGLLDWEHQASAPARMVLDSLSERATAVMRSLMGSDGSLEAVLHDPIKWLDGRVVEWTGTDSFGTELPLSSLGAGSARWARMAISLALNNVQYARPALLVVDEPERALHSAAQLQVAQTFARTLSDVELKDLFVVAEIVATHSPAFLSLPGANLLHVTRGTDRNVVLEAIDTTIGVEGLTAALGLTRPDALLTVRWFMFVEGEHDVAVIRALFGDTLRDKHVHLCIMSGASNIQAHLTAQHLLAFSDAKLRVVLDRLGATAGEYWELAKVAFNDGDVVGTRRELEKVSRLPGREAKWLYEAGLAALERGQLDRIELVGLIEKDIINYLPVEQIVPGAASWRTLSKEFFDARPSLAFKDWLKKSKGARITASRLGEIAGTLTELRDLPRVIQGL